MLFFTLFLLPAYVTGKRNAKFYSKKDVVQCERKEMISFRYNPPD